MDVLEAEVYGCMDVLLAEFCGFMDALVTEVYGYMDVLVVIVVLSCACFCIATTVFPRSFTLLFIQLHFFIDHSHMRAWWMDVCWRMYVFMIVFELDISVMSYNVSELVSDSVSQPVSECHSVSQ